jgi:LPS sulfotransferase NodH
VNSDFSFWAVQNETGSVDRFLSRLDGAVVFADPEFSQVAKAQSAARYELTTLEPQADESLFAKSANSWSGRNVFLFCVTDYARRAARLKEAAQKAGARFVDWPFEVFPSFVGFNDSWRLPKPALQEPGRKFVIISTARSGSTYLAELMHRNGFGNPKEHIRTPYCELIRRRKDLGLDLDRFGRRLERACAHNGVFGTKVISGFLWPVLAELDPQEANALFGAWASDPVVYLVRESKVEQTVSDYVANATKTWHVRSAGDQQTYEKALNAVSFDFDIINKRFASYVKDELALRGFIQKLNNVRQIAYADLVADPQGRMRDLMTFIDAERMPETIVTTTELVKTTSAKHGELARAFVEEARRRNLYRDMAGDPLFSELQ